MTRASCSICAWAASPATAPNSASAVSWPGSRPRARRHAHRRPRMSDETAQPRAPRARRTAADRLRAALADLHAHHGQVLTHTEKAWASITFAGTRHSLAILFAGDEAVEVGEEFVAGLPDH